MLYEYGWMLLKSMLLQLWFLEHCQIPHFRRMKGGVPRYSNWDLKKRMSAEVVLYVFENLPPNQIIPTNLPLYGNEAEVVNNGCQDNFWVKYDQLRRLKERGKGVRVGTDQIRWSLGRRSILKKRKRRVAIAMRKTTMRREIEAKLRWKRSWIGM